MTDPTQAPRWQTVAMPPLERQARALPDSYDPSARTVEVVYATDTPVQRHGFLFEQPWIEELEISEGAIRTGRLEAGASVLDGHMGFSGRDAVGATTGRLPSPGVAELRLTEAEDAQPLVQRVADGTLSSVSVGYIVHRYEDITGEDDEIRRFRAVDWEPVEISLVAVPADPNAKVRSEPMARSHPCQIMRRDIEPEPADDEDSSEAAEPGGQKDEQRAADAASEGGRSHGPETRDKETTMSEQEAARVREAERQRVRDIEQAGQLAGWDSATIRGYIDQDYAADAVRQAAIEAANARDQATATSPYLPADARQGYSAEDPDQIRAGMAEAIAARCGAVQELSEVGQQYRAHRMSDMIRGLAEARGISTRGRSIAELTRGMHTTSDFPALMEDSLRKTLRPRFEAMPRTYRAIADRSDFVDFKEQSFPSIGDFPAFERRNEGGEYRAGSISDQTERVTPETFGRLVRLSWESLVNDDLGAFDQFSRLAARRAVHFEEQRFYEAALAPGTSGPNMEDGNPLFDGAHNNEAGAGDITVANVGAARRLMREQESLDGVRLNIGPSILLVGPERETEAQQLVADTQPNTIGEVNPFSGTLQVVVSGEIEGDDWYLVAAPDMAPYAVWGYLQDEPGLQVETEMALGGDVTALAKLAFQAGPVEYRSIVRNPGS